jgi:hypothetical protein
MINLSRQIYAAWDTGLSKDKLPEAEIIPIGDTINEKKKIETVTSKYPVIAEHDNIPLPGFTLYKMGRKKWNSVDQSWLVIDPRGFLVRITNDNLEKILYVTGITEGLIQEKCVWIRDDSQTRMILVPISSDEYTEAVVNTQLIEDKVDKKTVQIGDRVLLQNKLEGIYLGMMSLYGPINNYSIGNEYRPQTYPRRHILEVEPGKYHHQGNFKILKILEKTNNPLEKQEAVKRVNQEIATGTSRFTAYTDFTLHSAYSRGKVELASIKTVSAVDISFIEIDFAEATSIFNNSLIASDMGNLLLSDSSDKNYVLDLPYIYSHGFTTTSFEITQVKNKIERCNKIELIDPRHSWGKTNRTRTFHKLTDFKKFYKIVKHVKSDSY